MRPHAHKADEPTRLATYRQIIDRYLRYILIRCLAYTNDRTLAERITAYTLITTCLISDRLRRMADLGIVVDTMIEMVGQDQAGSEKGIGNSEESDELPVFLLPAQMCEVAGAINGLDRLERQMLVLHHIAGLAAPDLADIQKMPQKRIEKALAKGERQFVELLRGMSSWDHDIEPDVHSLLTDFAACLDAQCSQDLGAFALRYVTDHR